MPLPLHPCTLWFYLRFSDLDLKRCRNPKMPSLCELTMQLLFIHNFCWINFPPAAFILAFLGLPQTFLGSLLASFPFVSMGSPNLVKQQWPVAGSACCQWGTSHQPTLTAAVRQLWCPYFRKPMSWSPSAPSLHIPAFSILLNSCTFSFSESFTFQHGVWSREERGCTAHGIYAEGRGPKSCKVWSCVSAWMLRRKTVFVFNSCPWLQVESLLAPACGLVGVSPRLPGFVGNWGCCSRGRHATAATRWPQSLTIGILLLLVSQTLQRVQKANRALWRKLSSVLSLSLQNHLHSKLLRA